ncbi:MAG: beta-propeller domain-containing protein, partial [Bifidobacteriaceae bacterium]|nr:beta-propeller domain-containing protein [Bifidobacteriaceae bacterium]
NASVYVEFEAAQTVALLYDVSNPAAPVAVGSFSQSGAHTASRLRDGRLYVVSQYTVASTGAVESNRPETFVPLLDGPEGSQIMPPADIHITPEPSAPTYSVVTAVDVARRERLGQEAVLGGSETVYMSDANLYLASSVYSGPGAVAESGDLARFPGSEEAFAADAVTRLVRVDLAARGLAVAAEGTVPGTLINQFALDEHAGRLRLAVTVSGTVPVSSDGDVAGEWADWAALDVLDLDLRPVGSIPSLVEGESVQSVRFDGDVGYVVTFKQVDPLFAVDLAEPDNPKVMSALKIPGFSTYLHPYADGRLLGLGMDGDAAGGIDGLKLAMFDTSDPFDVTETAKARIGFDESPALANHKAIMVEPGRNLIGFPALGWDRDGFPEASYRGYGYDRAAGFSKRAELPVSGEKTGYSDGRDYHSDNWDRWQALRGLHAGDFLYVCTPATVQVFELDGFGQVAQLVIAEEEW